MVATSTLCTMLVSCLSILNQVESARAIGSPCDRPLGGWGEGDRYQLMRVGWKGLKRVYYIVLHFDSKDGKVWLQQNTTDIDLGKELLEFGIPNEDIMMGLILLTKDPIRAMVWLSQLSPVLNKFRDAFRMIMLGMRRSKK